ncbi:MAG: arsenate reductase (glutaredoxin) [Opitutaceae bacterium]|nr:arsenate reductase (glutaredoxin) [Opitutaceae bacterium]|tara:strand:- start:14473 stop:14835 length:363 start_codon:yes stop_codon:yes gene_type:complete
MKSTNDKLYYNPRCSKCRAAKKILQDHGVEAEVIEYLKAAPSVATLDVLCTTLGIEPQQLIRNKEPRFQELGLSLNDPLSRDEWLTIISENPILLERPIYVSGKNAVIGRPPKKVMDMLA